MTDDEAKTQKEIEDAARNIVNALATFRDNPDEHGNTKVFRCGLGDVFAAAYDPRFFVQYTVGPDLPTVDAVRDDLDGSIFWQSVRERRNPSTILEEREQATGRPASDRGDWSAPGFLDRR